MSVKHIAIINCYRQGLAENESAHRIEIAARRLGIAVTVVNWQQALERANPDLAIAFSYHDPKVCGIPTYGLTTHPLNFFLSSGANIRNVLTYDGYLTVSPVIREWLEDLCFGARKHATVIEYVNSYPDTAFVAPDLTRPRLAYFGTNWDGPRFGDLFRRLAADGTLRAYGPKDKWAHIPQAGYGGEVPFGGDHVINRYREAGVGLCINRDDFAASLLPTSRIFEIAAAGAVPICGRDAWIEDHFGDCVLFVDVHEDLSQAERQIRSHLDWIRENPADAVALAERANARFRERFTLEAMLQNLLRAHRELMREKGCDPKSLSDDLRRPTISVIMRTGNRPKDMLYRALRSLAAQTAGNISVKLVEYAPQEGASTAQADFPTLRIERLERTGARRSTALWEGLRAVDTEWFAILDDDDELMPNHFWSLLQTLERNNRVRAWYGEVRLAYSGSVERLQEGTFNEPVSEPELILPRISPARLKLFEAYHPTRFLSSDFPLGTCCCLMKSDLLDEEVLQDPRLDIGEDQYLFTLLSARTHFAFSVEPTAIIHLHGQQSDYQNDDEGWLLSRRRILFRTWGQSFPLGGALSNFRKGL